MGKPKKPPKHTKEDLKQMQSLPLESKIIMTKRRIEEWYTHWNEHGGGCYVSFSGGKDSTVLKHIVDNMYSDVPSVFVDTGLEYPEIKKFVREIKEGKYKDKGFNSDIVTLRPEKRFDKVIKDVGYPVISKEVAQCAGGAKIFLDDVKKIALDNGEDLSNPKSKERIETMFAINKCLKSRIVESARERERERESQTSSVLQRLQKICGVGRICKFECYA